MYLQYMNCSIASLHAILHTRHVTRQLYNLPVVLSLKVNSEHWASKSHVILDSTLK